LLVLTGAAAINGTGNALNNTISGNDGANILNGGGGSDILIGGLGDDTYVTDGGDTITEAANAGTDTVQSSVSLTLGANLENLTLTGTAAINGTGNALNNTITGNAAANVLNGGAGVDVLIGGLGDDTYYVDNTSDVVREVSGGGVDVVIASATFSMAGQNIENLTLTGSSAINATGNGLANHLIGNAAANALNGGGGADVMEGGLGNDTYVTDGGDTIIEAANAGTDTVQSSVTLMLGDNLENLTLIGTAAINGTGNALNNTITGNAAANVLNGGAGVDVLIGGLGDDTYYVDNTSDVVREVSGGGVDVVIASATFSMAGQNIENLTLTGSSAINATGNGLANHLIGNAAANALNGGGGADVMEGGLGDDTYVTDGGDTITEAANAGTDTVQSSVSLTLGDNLENLTLIGTAAINGTGNALNNTITGNAAANVLNGGAGVDVLIGGLGDDTYYVDNTSDVVREVSGGGVDVVIASVTFSLAGQNIENLTLTGSDAINATGNGLANYLIGNAAANVLNGGGGVDVMEGGLGDDTYVTDGGDTIIEAANAGTDTVQSSVTLTLGDNLENLTLTGTASDGTGNALNNTITGNAAANVLNGGAGVDVLIGGLGDDTYYVDNAGDVVKEAAGGGVDTVNASVTFSLAGQNIENLTLTGSAAINATGNGLANHLIGNAAANVLSGGLGTDTLEGGLGADRYLFNTTLNGVSNVDTIVGFSVVDDKIALDHSVFASLTTLGTLSADAFYIGAGAHDATDRLIYNAGVGGLYYDADGNGAGAAVQFATLSTGLNTLANTNFVVV
ncbi:RTX toxin, partial [Rhodoblastus acidophilus]